MVVISEVDAALAALGQRLRAERLRRNEAQRVFAARLGVSVPTLHKMEQGDGGVQVRHWITALYILGRLGELDALLREPESLFEKYRRQQQPKRQRASRQSNCRSLPE